MFAEPPRTHSEFMVWRVFVASCEAEVWQYVNRWIKKYGNPFKEVSGESYEEHDRRLLYQMALTVTYKNR